MRKFESSQTDASGAQSADFSKAYRKPRAFIYILPLQKNHAFHTKHCWG